MKRRELDRCPLVLDNHLDAVPLIPQRPDKHTQLTKLHHIHFSLHTPPILLSRSPLSHDFTTHPLALHLEIELMCSRRPLLPDPTDATIAAERSPSAIDRRLPTSKL